MRYAAKCEVCCKFIKTDSNDIIENIATYDTGCESFELYPEYRHKVCIERQLRIKDK